MKWQRGIDGGMAFVATVGIYFDLSVLVGGVLKSFLEPVGANKAEVLSLIVFPAVIIFAGSLQGRWMTLIHIAAVAAFWTFHWRFVATFDPSEHMGPLGKELPWIDFTAALLSLLSCGIIAGGRNFFSLLHGENVSLRIPFRGNVVVWKSHWA